MILNIAILTAGSSLQQFRSGSTVVRALHYKPQDCRFEPGLYLWRKQLNSIPSCFSAVVHLGPGWVLACIRQGRLHMLSLTLFELNLIYTLTVLQHLVFSVLCANYLWYNNVLVYYNYQRPLSFFTWQVLLITNYYSMR